MPLVHRERDADEEGEREVIMLPVKLPPDITVVKEVPSTPSPAKRGRGRPRKNTTSVLEITPAPTSPTTSEILFRCSLCPRTFHSAFGLKIHESACRRHNPDSMKETQSEEEIIIPDPLPEKTTEIVKPRRGRPPKDLIQEITKKSSPIIEPEKHECGSCSRVFNSATGLRIHENACKRRKIEESPVSPEIIIPDKVIPEEGNRIFPDICHRSVKQKISNITFRDLQSDLFFSQDKGMAMGSPLSPIFTNIFMEEFERKALASAQGHSMSNHPAQIKSEMFLDDEISDLEDSSDIDVPELDSDVSLEDYSSGSGKENVPNFEDRIF
ncbi:hypothetical protein J6590_064624 [Homalodisca vitripennis]|nr:hypothetical protein J6590_064624 [Homalodisca vitripennis]